LLLVGNHARAERRLHNIYDCVLRKLKVEPLGRVFLTLPEVLGPCFATCSISATTTLRNIWYSCRSPVTCVTLVSTWRHRISSLVSIRAFDVEPANHVGSRLDFGYIDPPGQSMGHHTIATFGYPPWFGGFDASQYLRNHSYFRRTLSHAAFAFIPASAK
jgi:hypothetical protein